MFQVKRYFGLKNQLEGCRNKSEIAGVKKPEDKIERPLNFCFKMVFESSFRNVMYKYAQFVAFINFCLQCRILLYVYKFSSYHGKFDMLRCLFFL